ncbi:hypothetical protein F4604DRAFT_1934221 [Suillus subluteus]|nr:hypothetical protein F4604DRAFT_1934221 [Suillus subluteus]
MFFILIWETYGLLFSHPDLPSPTAIISIHLNYSVHWCSLPVYAFSSNHSTIAVHTLPSLRVPNKKHYSFQSYVPSHGTIVLSPVSLFSNTSYPQSRSSQSSPIASSFRGFIIVELLTFAPHLKAPEIKGSISITDTGPSEIESLLICYSDGLTELSLQRHWYDVPSSVLNAIALWPSLRSLTLKLGPDSIPIVPLHVH